ncbi:MAG: ABC transporter permease [Acidobacteriota bacterium]|nr:ABC transporter permease [Acidobacteriota bacterium]
MKRTASVFLVAVGACALLAPQIAPYSYERQFREAIDAPPGPQFPLGTDALGRDRFSRLLYATRVSVLLAPGAAFVSVAIALLVACLGLRGGSLAGHAVGGVTTICLSLPWIFLFIIMRAELPLDTAPPASVLLTFALMGVAGWAWPARVFTASIGQLSDAGWVVHARACGLSGWRIATVHMWPHLRDIALAQFGVLVPAYILSEASLGLLGLGVADPLPSWGNMLQDLQHPDLIRANPLILAPLALLMLVMLCLENLRTPETGL